ncbi:2,3-bisphosphoglycerate-independent phosphoglycerate mutase [Marivibrio halodurans]|uniref:2,3-bisphosphoglycerate-independent phosphoglycerate mutase n=1 Tax=Marivibrio halodurans TaxID=2039722 RepID=A0A8J7V5J2_9PROT|nr:2,3-bisphosphoglycerate-independent phosphoglycerate mutase [Marivibrio halodurans]MBP5859009.1 2,3-bisphosphoglycerate-independent phosphoglycerate mutase [Marivibrio halodurans]
MTQTSPTPRDGAPGARRPKPTILCILDGYGARAETDNNAIAAADTPVMDRLMSTCPHAELDASEHHVGLPDGQMGNSEVGHMNIGAGRVVLQDLPRIDQAMESGELTRNPALLDFAETVKARGGTAHLMGLLSPGGVHAHQDHIAALAEALIDLGVRVAVHAILDGRDTPPRSAEGYLKNFAVAAPRARIATVSGRYFAMDRDKRWDRVSKAYDTIARAEGAHAADALDALAQAYERDEKDEFVTPTVLGDYTGMADGDGLLMANFRADRAREILTALLDPIFDGFDRGPAVAFSGALGMVEYSKSLNTFMTLLFPPETPRETLGEVVSTAGLRQLRIAETEKYAHVTFFFNGGEEEVFEGEERILVPSPDVATYDLKPEMSAEAVTDKLIEAIESDRFDLIVVNYANPDMVGHTGVFDAAVKAIETVDHCVGRLEEAVTAKGGAMLITADHGNADMMLDTASGQAHTAHTMNRVPLVYCGPRAEGAVLADGRLADLAPTLLAIMGLDQPEAMSGTNLIRRADRQAAE